MAWQNSSWRYMSWLALHYQFQTRHFNDEHLNSSKPNDELIFTSDEATCSSQPLFVTPRQKKKHFEKKSNKNQFKNFALTYIENVNQLTIFKHFPCKNNNTKSIIIHQLL